VQNDVLEIGLIYVVKKYIYINDICIKLPSRFFRYIYRFFTEIGLVKFLSSDDEKELGLTYVDMSRVLACKEIDIGPRCSLERLTKNQVDLD
jgi:hypothetical protein